MPFPTLLLRKNNDGDIEKNRMRKRMMIAHFSIPGSCRRCFTGNLQAFDIDDHLCYMSKRIISKYPAHINMAFCPGEKTMNQKEYKKIISLAIEREVEAYTFYSAVSGKPRTKASNLFLANLPKKSRNTSVC